MTVKVRDRRTIGRRFLVAFLVAFVACLVALALNASFSEIRPDNAWGLTYGSLAAVLLLGTAIYGMRRRAPRSALRLKAGRAQIWLGFHLWGGLLFLLLMLMHSGFRVPSGWVTWWLWALSLWTVSSGILGRALQRWIPRVLASGLATEALYERIPELVEEIRQRAAAIAESADEAVESLHDRTLAPIFAAPRRSLIYFIDITGGIKKQLREFGYLRDLLPSKEKEKLSEIEHLLRTKLELDAHYTLQPVLRLWLYSHLPITPIVVLLLLLHLYTVVFY